MADPSLALQEAIFARLQAEVSCPIYDGAPLNAEMPYVSIDREVSVNSSPIAGRKRETRLLYLSVWSDAVGQAEVKRINGEVIAALDERRLPLEVGRAVSIRVEQADAQRDADGITYQGSITVRVITTH
ncbi:hypothetical protein A210_09870 [Pseudomonas putida SJTE-1]|uniref:DUF3168 domain-containing protein n=1 Tax=Pseudomonas putida ND6 TaxID=231023 RepID=I3V1T5_PSEPU|nr:MULTISPECIES: DUF3168 domain-containing protein [Pseudomonas putida group]AFK71706.1 hypothetical protein YSA_09122 [Pseudomonas putida ND6]ANC80510.1 hypothetical protein KKK_05640 [Pseudomonas putida B6-2]ANI02916.1 hypothetical protein A210_09870 [Pseudomonas putida SJTE-1]MCE0992006.1 DUF3168 domain-containing protein [Pseudomonas alloputida]QKL07016.1 DUF3168 domain-containing protein [Pseudomonas putida]